VVMASISRKNLTERFTKASWEIGEWLTLGASSSA